MSADRSDSCRTGTLAGSSREGCSEAIDGATGVHKGTMEEKILEQEPVQQVSRQSSLPPSTMLPLGLGSGSGLGSQHGKMNKFVHTTTTTVMPSAESEGWGVDARDDKGRTALHFACGMAPADCARLLLEAGADINARDKDGCTPLHMAAGYGRCHSVKLLLEHGASVSVRERQGRTPRELAVEIREDVTQGQAALKIPRGDIDLTIRLLADAETKYDLSAEENIQNLPANRSTPTSEARSAAGPAPGNAEELRVQSNQAGSSGKPKKTVCAAALGNALTVACRGGHVDVAELLLSSGADVDAHDLDGATPLLAAADSGFANCVQLLLKHGANADAKDRVGVTALIAAAYNGHVDCLRILLKCGASVDARSHGGVTPLIAAAEGRNADCSRVLLQAGAHINARTSEGKTALMHAVSRNCVEATEVLLVGGADMNAADVDGCTALHQGARNNSVESLRILLEREADVTRKCRRGRTPLQEAPKGSQAAQLLEERWRQLESEIAVRQEEVLNLFAQEKSELKSNLSKKPSTRHAREKKNGKRKKDPIDKAEVTKQELTKATTQSKTDGESQALDALSSPGSEMEGNPVELTEEQDPPGLLLTTEGSSSHIESKDRCEEGAVDNDAVGGSLGTEKNVREECTSNFSSGISCTPAMSESFSAEESALRDNDEWIRVDGKAGHHHQHRTATPAATLKTYAFQSKSQGGATSALAPSKSVRPGEIPSIDHLPPERKISGDQSNIQSQGVSRNAREDDCKDGESSPWVQVLLRRNSNGDGISTRPHGDAALRHQPPGPNTQDAGDIAADKNSSTEESLSDRVQRIERELERTKQASRADMQKVKELELLVSARGVGRSETTSVQVSELTHALEVQIIARVRAENANIELEFRIRDLESVVSSQRKALELAQTEIAELKLQRLRREDQLKQESETQQKESMAAAMAAAAASWRAWELQLTRDSSRGWVSECESTSAGELAPLLQRSSYKMEGDAVTSEALPVRKKKGAEQGDRESFEWMAAATAAAVAAASMLGSKNCGCSTLGAHLSYLLQDISPDSTVSGASIKTGSRKCTWNQHEASVKQETNEYPAGQEPSKVGKGSSMTRSASEGSLHSAGVVTEQQEQEDLLPFIPKAGPKTDPVNGWFSLVPSPLD